MATLDTKKLEEIAQYLNGSGFKLNSGQKNATFAVPGLPQVYKAFKDGKLSETETPAVNAYIEKILVPNGFYTLVQNGVSSVEELVRLQYLVAGGVLGADEADAFLTTKYGVSASANGYSFAFIPTVQKQNPQQVVEAEIIQSSAGQTELTTPTILESVQAAKSKTQIPGNRPIVPAPAFVLPVLSEDNEPEEVQGLVNELSQQTQSELGRLMNGRGIVFQPHSILGDSIVPGTLPATALIPSELAQQIGGIPGPEEAIGLTLSPDNGLDRFLSTTVSSVAYTGPGRVWRVSNFQLPADFRPDRQFLRYRIVKPGMKLSVLGVRCIDEVTAAWSQSGSYPRMEVQYGLVISGIPNLLRGGARKLMAAAYEGDAPGSLIVQRDGVTGSAYSAAFKVFEPFADTTFRTTPQRAYSAVYTTALGYNGGGLPTIQHLNPGFKFTGENSTYLDRIVGFGFSLITGQTQEEVFAQINGRESANLPYLGGQPSGERASVPEGLDVPPPCVSSCSSRVSGGTNNRFVPRYAPNTPTSYGTPVLGGDDYVIEGVPFLGADCQSLRATAETFTLVVQVWPPRIVPQSQMKAVLYDAAVGAEFRPATWPACAVEVAPINGREVGIDIIVG